MQANRRGQSIGWLPLLVMAAALVVACVQVALDLRTYTPTWVKWSSTRISADLNGDSREELLVLNRGKVEVYEDESRCYVSPVTWAVSDAFCAEIDEEPGPEVMLVAWRRGSFGRELPFWHKRNDSDVSQHVFIFKYREGGLQPIWMSSELAGGARRATLDDHGRLHLVDEFGMETVWQWDNFGLKLLEGNEEGNAPFGGQEGCSVGPGARDVEPVEGGGSADESDAASTATLVAVGDNIVHDSLYAQMRTTDAWHFDFTPVYAPIADSVRSADIAAVVQETPLVEDPLDYAGYPSFGTPADVGEALADAGFDVVCAATNHAFDRGVQGIVQTSAFWQERYPEISLLGIHADGTAADSVEIREAGGITFALLDYTYGLNNAFLPDSQPYLVDLIGDGDRVERQVASVEGRCDLTVCFLHVGKEYAAEPTVDQKALVERLVNAGADIVICSHPHVVQPMERIVTDQGREAYVYWSLGNFASHQAQLRTVLGGMACITAIKDTSGVARVETADFVPVVCHYTDATTAVYRLDDYSEQLAQEHYLNSVGTEVSLSNLRELWGEEAF